MAKTTYSGATGQPPSTVQPARSRLLPVLLGMGVGILILALVLLLATSNLFGPTEAELAATNTQIGLDNATPTPTATQTPIPTLIFSQTSLSTPTQAPTPTPLPILAPQLGQITQDIYTSQLLDPSLLDQQNVTWNRDFLFTVPISFTNNGQQPINYNEIKVGLFAAFDELTQIPSFFLSNDDGGTIIEPGQTRTLRWQIVLPRDVQLKAWAVEYNDHKMSGFLDQKALINKQ